MGLSEVLDRLPFQADRTAGGVREEAPYLVRNPRTGVHDFGFDPPSEHELDETIDELRKAQPVWQSFSVLKRVAALEQWRAKLIESRAALIDALYSDTGRLTESVMEVDMTVAAISRWSGMAQSLLAEPPHRQFAIPFINIGTAYHPYPLVGVISPWNFPLLLAMIDALPALLAGAAVIVKPSEITPRFVRPLRDTLAEVPNLASVLKIVPGTGVTGAQLVNRVDAICFTGSVPTGRKVAEAAAKNLIPAFLELGGKDPALVLAGADLDRASSAILWGATANAGQSCLSIERVYVDRSIHDDLVDRLVQKASKLELAYPGPRDGSIGPIISEQQAEIIKEHLADALAKGARACTGGDIVQLGGGLWCRPTILTHVDHSMLVMTEETFGPIVPVMPFDSLSEAIDLANATPFGLSAAVFAGKTDLAEAVARKLHAGAVSINDAALTAIVHEAEKTAFKSSGLGGSRMGPSALKRFMRRQALLINTGSGPARDPWWYEDSGH